MKKSGRIATKTEVVPQHKHFWQLHQSGFFEGTPSFNRYATFFCDCGAEKVVQIKRVDK